MNELIGLPAGPREGNKLLNDNSLEIICVAGSMCGECLDDCMVQEISTKSYMFLKE